MRFIDTFKEGDRISDIYLCKFKQILQTKSGKPYETVILQDKTGVIDGKIWEPNSQGINEYNALDYVEVVGDIVNYQGGLQFNIKRIRICESEEFSPTDYLPMSNKDIDGMYDELLKYLKSVKNEYLHQLIEIFFVKSEKIKEAFKRHSAAKSVHHSFIGGLLEHTLAVIKLCDFYTQNYPLLNRDLLLTAAAFHDIGKLKELSQFPANDYTDDGQLLGHIAMGSEWISDGIRQIPNFPTKLARELKHCILAHHGELEFGSPKKPALAEAVALYYADNTDAKMQTLTELFNAPATTESEWLGYNRLFESNLRKTSVWN